MCMVAVSDSLIQEAIETNTIEKDFSQESLSKVVENLLEEKIKAKRRKRILQYEGTGVLEGETLNESGRYWNDSVKSQLEALGKKRISYDGTEDAQEYVNKMREERVF